MIINITTLLHIPMVLLTCGLKAAAGPRSFNPSDFEPLSPFSSCRQSLDRKNLGITSPGAPSPASPVVSPSNSGAPAPVSPLLHAPSPFARAGASSAASSHALSNELPALEGALESTIAELTQLVLETERRLSTNRDQPPELASLRTSLLAQKILELEQVYGKETSLWIGQEIQRRVSLQRRSSIDQSPPPTSSLSPHPVKIPHLVQPKLVTTLAASSSEIQSAAYTRDGYFVLTTSRWAPPVIWDIQSKQMRHAFQGGGDRELKSTFSPDGRWIAIGHSSGEIQIYDQQTHRHVVTLRSQTFKKKGHTSDVLDLHFSSDSQRIISGSFDGTAKIWDLPSGKLLKTLPIKGEGGVRVVRFSRKDQWLLTATTNGSAKLWDSHSGELLKTYDGFLGGIYAIDIAPDEKTFVAGCADSFVRIWDTHSGSLLAQFDGHDRIVKAVAYSSSGRWIVSADGPSGDNKLFLWDTVTKQHYRLQSENGGPSSVDLPVVLFHPTQEEFLTNLPKGKELSLWRISPIVLDLDE